jgi:hypothetical protein
VLLKKVVVGIIIGNVIEEGSMNSVRTGIVIEISIIGIVEKDSTARVEAGIVSDKVGVVGKRNDVERALSLKEK